MTSNRDWGTTTSWPTTSAVILVVIVAIASALRLLGLAFGLPAVYNPDEVAILNRALGLASNGLNPHNFLYPSLYFYALFVWEGLWFAAGRVVGTFGSLAAFERSFFVDPTSIYLAARLLTVVCGAATVLATYALGSRLYGRTAGIMAALFLAVSPLAVRDSHYVKHDIPVTLLIVLAHALIARVLLARRPVRPSAWIAAGTLCGLAMSTHYYAIVVAVPLAIATLTQTQHSGATHNGRARTGLLAFAACGLAFILGSPFLLVEPQGALRDIVANRAIVMDRATEATGLFGSASFYLRWLATDAAGVIAFALAGAGAVLTVASGWRPVVIALSFPAVFICLIANTYPASRYLNPLLPFVAVLAGHCLSWLGSRGGGWRLAAVLVGAAAVLEGTVTSVRADLFFRQTDTRTLAQRWIEEHVPPETSVLIQPYSVPLQQSRSALIDALTTHLGSSDRASIKFQRQMALTPYPAPAYRTIFLGAGGLDVDKIYVAPAAFDEARGLAPLRALSVTHLVLKRYNEPDPSLSALDAALVREGRLLARFSPYERTVEAGETVPPAPFLHNTDARIATGLVRPGPTIEIWTIQ